MYIIFVVLLFVIFLVIKLLVISFENKDDYCYTYYELIDTINTVLLTNNIKSEVKTGKHYMCNAEKFIIYIPGKQKYCNYDVIASYHEIAHLKYNNHMLFSFIYLLDYFVTFTYLLISGMSHSYIVDFSFFIGTYALFIIFFITKILWSIVNEWRCSQFGLSTANVKDNKFKIYCLLNMLTQLYLPVIFGTLNIYIGIIIV